MKDFNEISDNELNELLKEKILKSEDSDKLLDLQANVVFAGKASVAPPLAKEKALFEKLGVKVAGKFSLGWVFTSLSVAVTVVVTSVLLMSNSETKEIKKTEVAANIPGSRSEVVLGNDSNRPIVSEESSTARAVTVNPTVTPVKSVSTLADVRSMEPVSTSTVTPVNTNPTVSETKTATPSIPTINLGEKTGASNAKPVVACRKPISSCRIWNTKDFCSDIDSLKYPYGIECNSCEYSMDCKEYNGKKLTAVVFRLYKKSGLDIAKNFQNIHLIRTNGKKYTPVAISVDNFMNGVSKARVNFKNVVDIILLFPEASVGDKVAIDDVVEVVIE